MTHRIRVRCSLLGACTLLITAAVAQTPDVAALIAEFGGEAAAKPRSPAELSAAFDAVLDSLLPGMGAETIADREKPQQSLERICHHAGRPGADAERAALCAAMCRRLDAKTPQAARVWLLRKLEPLGGAESVEAVAVCLNEADAAVRDAARRALQSNPATQARDALLKALDGASDAAVRVGLVNALATRRDPALAPKLVELSGSGDEVVSAAALAGLGEIASEETLAALIQVWMGPQSARRRAAGGSILRTAERLIAGGKGAAAAGVYEALIRSAPPPHLLAAGLYGLAKSRGEGALPALRDAYRTSKAEGIRPIAARIAGEIPGSVATTALAADLPTVESDVQIVLLDVLAERGDKAALPAVARMAASADEAVRVAALNALGRFGGAELIDELANVATGASGLTLKAAREALATLRGPEVDESLLIAMRRRDQPKMLIEYTKALAARRHKPAVSSFFAVLEVKDADVHAAAYEGLGELAAQADLPRCIRVLAEAPPDLSTPAENMVATVCLRIADRDQRAQPLLDELQRGSAKSRPSLIRVLGRLEGAAALAAIRRAAEDTANSDLADAAMRALASWTSTEVLPDLQRIIGSAGSEPVHRTLALRGLARLVKLPSDRTPEQTFALLESAWKSCQRPDERKLVLGALGDLRSRDAMRLAQSAVADEELRDEAAFALVSIAKCLFVVHRDEADAAIRAVLDAPVGERPKKAAADALDWVSKFDGCITTWQYCGPYAQQGKNSTALIEIAFPPEPGAPQLPDGATGPATPEWKPLTSFTAGNPWIADFTAIDKGVSRCIYVRATIVSESDQAARLEIGSDDGVAAWLNGEPIHKKPAARSVTPGDDKVSVKLKKGENALLLKVTQGDGGWGVCCGVRSPEGGKLAGATFRAE